MGLLIVSCTSVDAAYDAQKLAYCDALIRANKRLTPEKVETMTIEQAERIRELTDQINKLVDELE